MARGVLSAAVASAILSLASPGQASAGQSCWQRLVHDWADGRITGLYPVSCYRQALARMPEDLQAYSSAPDDIEAALQQRIHRAGASRSLELSVGGERRGGGRGWTRAATPVALGGGLAFLLAAALGLAFRAGRRRVG